MSEKKNCVGRAWNGDRNGQHGLPPKNAVKLIPFALLIISVFFSSICLSDERESKYDQRMEINMQIIRLEIGGYLFNIPLNYFYGQGLEKWKSWPRAKKEMVKVDSIGLSMLLPDLRPYLIEDDARWKQLGHGERVDVSVMKPVGEPDWFGRLQARTEDYASKGKFYRAEPNKYGLRMFSEKTGSRYFASDGLPLTIACDNENDVKSPSCKVKTDYLPGIVLEYYYAISFLHDWQEIDRNIKHRISQFIVSSHK